MLLLLSNMLLMHATIPGCPRRYYKVLFSFLHFIRLLEGSYFCLFLMKGLIKVLFWDLKETSIAENCLPATSHKNACLNGVRSIRGHVVD